MKQLSIYLADGTFDGDITMSSPNSKFVAIRVARENLVSVRSDLEFSGVYMLLIGSDTVYRYKEFNIADVAITSKNLPTAKIIVILSFSKTLVASGFGRISGNTVGIVAVRILA